MASPAYTNDRIRCSWYVEIASEKFENSHVNLKSGNTPDCSDW